METDQLLQSLEPYLKRAAALNHALELNGWYSRTHASSAGRSRRSTIAGELARLAHEETIEPGLRLAITLLENDPQDGWSAFHRRFVSRLDFSCRRMRALPTAFVQEQQAAASVAHAAWLEAREQNDFGIFAPHLERTVGYARDEARMLGGGRDDPDSLYDALLGTYEPGMSVRQLRPIFEEVKAGIAPIIEAARRRESVANPWAGMTVKPYDVMGACQELATAIGFNFDRGGLDATMHPFCSTLGPDDVRLTTNPALVTKALLATAHEAGHGMFEQGMNPWLAEHLPFGFRYSLGIHESQSRLWENHVCRTSEFWDYIWREIYDRLGLLPFPDSRQAFVASLWQVRPQPIRIQADEVTYPLHIILRFELELQLLDGSLAVNDLPKAFDDKLEQYLGIRPTSLKEGVLQDIHWSEGCIGYFPTYLLGSLAAAQQFAIFQRIEPEWREQFQRGMFGHLQAWLQTEVYPRGHVSDFDLLVEEATGEPLNPKHWLNHVSARYGQPQEKVFRPAARVIEIPGGEIRTLPGGGTISST